MAEDYKPRRTHAYVDLALATRISIGHAASKVLVCIANRANPDGQCFCGYDDLILRSGYEIKAVIKGLKELREIVVNGQPLLTSKQMRNCNHYQLSLSVLLSIAHPSLIPKYLRPKEDEDVDENEMEDDDDENEEGEGEDDDIESFLREHGL